MSNFSCLLEANKFGLLKKILPKMLQIRNCFVLAHTPKVYTAAIQRFQTNVASAKNPEEQLSKNESEWQQARCFKDIPRARALDMLIKMMPGGKYSKLDIQELVLAMHEDYGDFFIMTGMLGRKPIISTVNPKDFEVVFRNEGIWPSRPANETLRYHREKYRRDFFQGVEGLITTRNKPWADFRSIVNPVLMQPKNVRMYYKKMSQVNRNFVERIKAIRDPNTLEVPKDFEEWINRWTLESVAVVALDKELGLLNSKSDNPQATKLFKSLNEFFEYSAELEVKPSIWRYVATPIFKKLMNSLDSIQEICAGYANEAIERIEAEAKQGLVRAENEQSVLEKLLKIDKKVATVMAIDMLTAGVDTTTSTFVAALLVLAKNPEQQHILREEVMQVLPDKDSELTEASMKNVPYLRACIKESQRIYPLIFANVRNTARDCVLNGYQVPADTQIVMVPLNSLQSEDYFPRAKEFLPERWLRNADNTEQSKALRLTDPFVFLPFGFGPRMCVGKRIVEMELELGLARIIRNFKIEFNHSTEKPFRSSLINTPNIPLQFKFIDLDN